MAKAEITAIDDRVERRSRTTPPETGVRRHPAAIAAADGTPPVIPATAGDAPQAVDPAVIVVVDDDTRAAAAATKPPL